MLHKIMIPAAVLGVDNEAPIPGLANGNLAIPIVPNQALNDGATTENPIPPTP